MKRIIGRSIIKDYDASYGDYIVKPVDYELLDRNAVPSRFVWALDIIDNLSSHGITTYRELDIGAHDGTLGALIAMIKYPPGIAEHNSTKVDVIESYKAGADACEVLAKSIRDHGFHMRAFNTTFEEFVPDCKYDMITAFEILEHVNDPFFCIEKIYEILEIGGRVLITVPEATGNFGFNDKNPFHLWSATVQSMVSTLFYDDRKWHIDQMFDDSGLLHVSAKKLSYQV
jgi:SAM-dependent methyltransferase